MRYDNNIKQCFFFLLIFLPFSVVAEIYKWKDANGNVYFGDQPTQDVKYKRVQMNEILTTTFTEVDEFEFAEPTERKVKVRKPKNGDVWLFTTPACRYCGKAKNYFKRKNIRYKELNVVANELNQNLFRAYGGKGVPFTLVGTFNSPKKLMGFNQQKFDAVFQE